MNTVFRIVVVCIATVLLGSDCFANDMPELAALSDGAVEANGEHTSYIINSQVGSVVGIAVGMTESQVLATGWRYELRTEIQEGDEYRVYYVHLDENTHLKCTLDLENMLYRIESSSAQVQDQFGLGVGSKLGELKQAYPNGRFISGVAEGRYANFLTGKYLRFYFDHNDLNDSCFDYGTKCVIDENIRVKSVAIG